MNVSESEKQRLCIISKLIDMEAENLSDTEIERCFANVVGGKGTIERVKQMVHDGSITEEEIK